MTTFSFNRISFEWSKPQFVRYYAPEFEGRLSQDELNKLLDQIEEDRKYSTFRTNPHIIFFGIFAFFCFLWILLFFLDYNHPAFVLLMALPTFPWMMFMIVVSITNRRSRNKTKDSINEWNYHHCDSGIRLRYNYLTEILEVDLFEDIHKRVRRQTNTTSSAAIIPLNQDKESETKKEDDTKDGKSEEKETKEESSIEVEPKNDTTTDEDDTSGSEDSGSDEEPPEIKSAQ
eukprot:TRINITY_DN704_c0_g1_i2.p1 TRINITY_DN704_c0_g1~~TRINITY_DN704_c0_g1_i2.p1  ORF type:complete len:231 (+),score=56.90 TRINITY_DN704_c0_g1_i2:51-743(+)